MTSSIPKNHPRYESLMLRERISDGLKKGLVHETGLIAHGRGEAFDYLLGEKTTSLARESIKTAAAVLCLASNPVISVNGNVVSLVADECVILSKTIPSLIEVNLFHQSEERVRLLIETLEKSGGEQVLGSHPTKHIPGLDHNRGWCEEKGIFSSDVILVPLEDGDRCQALKQMGKYVITIDLNPLSRTAQTADITIVDNIIRAIPRLTYWIQQLKKRDKTELIEIKEAWNNREHLHRIYQYLSERLNQIKP